MAALRLVHAIVMWRGAQGGGRSGGGRREVALGTRAAAVQVRQAGRLPTAGSRPDPPQASPRAGERKRHRRERAGEGDSPCGRLSNSPLLSGRAEVHQERAVGVVWFSHITTPHKLQAEARSRKRA